MRRSPLLALSALLAAPAHAGVLGSVYVDGSYQHQVEKDIGLQGEGYGAGASLDIGEHYFIGAGYSSIRTEPFATAEDRIGRLEYRSVGASVGGAMPVGERSGLSASVGYGLSQTVGLEALSEQPVEDAEGVTGSLGLTVPLAGWLSFSLGGGSSFVGGERSTSGSAGLTLQTLPGLWLDTGYWAGGDSEGWSAGLRVRIGH